MPVDDIGILTTDAGLVIRSWNDWLERATGIPAADACGRPLGALAPDVNARGLAVRLQETLASGAVHVLTPALHPPLIPCSPLRPSGHFERMQQHVTVAPVRVADATVAGLMITIEDVTPRLDEERAIAADLSSDDPGRREAAQQALARSRVESYDSFAGALGSDDWRVRRGAVEGLAYGAGPSVLRALVAALKAQHRDFNALSSALKLLATTDEDLTAPLAELLTDDDADLRIQAALALGEQHSPLAAEPLIQALEDPDPNVRFHAIEALGRLHAVTAVEPLVAVAESGDIFLAYAALDALALIQDPRIAPRLVPLLESADLRDAAIRTLSALGDQDAAEALTVALGRFPSEAHALAGALIQIDRRERQATRGASDVPALVRQAMGAAGRAALIAALERHGGSTSNVITVLGWLRDPSLAPVVAPLVSTPDTRAAAIDAIMASGPGAVEVLIAFCRSDDPEVAAAAVDALGRLGDRRATGPLLQTLDRGGSVGLAAAGALARLADPAAFEGLLPHLGHPDRALRRAVIGAVNAGGHPDLPARLEPSLDDPNPLVRESAVRIAGYFGFRQLAPRLLARADDPVEAVRCAVVEHLPFLEDPARLEHLQAALASESPVVRGSAARALAHVEAEDGDRLAASALQDPDMWVRYYGARALSRARGDAAGAALVRAAAGDPAVPVRIAALEALATAPSVDAEPVILTAADDPNDEVAAAALKAAGGLGTERSLAALLRASAADAAARRHAAVEGLVVDGSFAAADRLHWIAAGDPDRSLVERCVAGLGQIARRPGEAARIAVDALLALAAEPATTDIAQRAILALPADLIPLVATALEQPAPAMRRRAVALLAGLRHPDATAHLGAGLDDEDAGVREAAAMALARLGARQFQARLAELAAHDPARAVRRAAAQALARGRGET